MPKYMELTMKILKQLLAEHSLPTSGNKSEMVKRLTDETGSDEIDLTMLELIIPGENSVMRAQIDAMANTLNTVMGTLTKLSQQNEKEPEIRIVAHDENSNNLTSVQNRAENAMIGENDTINQNGTGTNVLNDNNNSGWHSVRDIIGVLPEFDPIRGHLSSKQFLDKINSLTDTYHWHENIVLYSVQSKMKGPAKDWLDAQPVFQKWSDFANDLLTDFPYDVTAADIHIEMMQRHQTRNETTIDYYYVMLALGRRGKIDEESIVQHIINGIYDEGIKKTLKTLNLLKCPQLYAALKGNAVSKLTTNQINISQRSKQPFQRDHKTNFVKTSYAKEDGTKTERKPIVCYNCGKAGHISVNCTEPQKKKRCQVCDRTTHTTEQCPNHRPNIHKIDGDNNSNLSKTIIVNGRSTKAYIDSGSNKSLIRSTFAYSLAQTTACKVMLKGFAGGTYECVEQIAANLEIDEKKLTGIMLVVDDDLIPEEILLGRDIICQAGMRITIEQNECKIENICNITAVDSLNTIEQAKLEKVFSENSNSFADTVAELGRCTKVTMNIEVTTTIPVQLRPYRIPFARRIIVTEAINELLQNKIIRPSMSSYASPVVLVTKRNGEPRLCVDYRCLNKITKKISFPMPIMEEQFAQLTGSKFYSTLDLRMGYHQIEIQEDAKQFTAFVTNDGHFEYNRMPFGLINAPAVFQSLMNQVVARMGTGEVLAYLDDVIIPSKTVDEGLERLERFFKVLAEFGLTLRRDKCKFLVTEIQHLGFTINSEGIKPGERKITAITEFKIPTNQTEVRRFLGLTGFFRKFVAGYAFEVEPLTRLLRQDKKEFLWTEEQQQAFTNLIDKLTNAPILQLYNVAAEHEVHTDASAVGIAGVLLQASDNKTWHPVCYYSRRCTAVESKCHSYELEVLAVVESLERFRIYLLGKSFRLVTDCISIASVKKQKELKPKIARWWMKLMEFDFEIIHRQGTRLAHVDALSRAPVEPAVDVEEAGFLMNIDDTYSDWLLTMQMQDSQIKRIHDILMGKLKTEQDKQIKTDYEIINHRLYRKTSQGNRFVIPKAVRLKIVQYCHDQNGHFSLDKTVERIRRTFWFPKMTKFVKEYIASCMSCCYYKSKGGKLEGKMHMNELQPIPFATIHIDHLGPFIRSKRGNTHVIAISDAFSKFLVVKAVKSTKTTPVINVINEMTSFFGLPNTIITDRGTAYTSKQFEEYCAENQIRHVKNAVRTPRANGQVERANRIILDYLRTSIKATKDWGLSLRELQFTVNSQRNSTTDFTPNELVFDFKLRDITTNIIAAALAEDVAESTDDKITIAEKRTQALTNIQTKRNQWKLRFDAKHAKPTIYCENDLVVIQNEPPSTGESRKLEPRFKGPFIVSKVLDNDRYLLENIPGSLTAGRKFCSVYTSEKMKPWCALMPDLDAEEEDYLNQPDDEN